MSAHTPGPWVVSDSSPLLGGYLITAGTDAERNHCIIASRSNWDHRAQESLANASLIAAAPDLLAAAKGLYLWLAPRRPDGRAVPAADLTDEDLEGHASEWRAFIKAHAAAIAKAEGR